MFIDANPNLQIILLIIFLSAGFFVINLVFGSLGGLGILIMMLVTRKIAKKLFFEQWMRSDKRQFERKCSNESLDYHLDMYNQGLKWRDKNKKYINKWL